jgi:FixJ family two-component response regulator
MPVADHSTLALKRTPVARRSWIAVLDDDVSVRTALARVLRAENIDVVTFASAQEFLAATELDPPACLVLDVHLGSVSGFELQEQLAIRQPELPLIFITAHDEISSAELARRAGPDGYLRKPFDSEIFLALVRRRAGSDLPAH